MSENNNQSKEDEIIILLKEQNELLKTLVISHKHRDRVESFRFYMHLINSLLPFIVAIATLAFLYITFRDYFDMINNNLNLLKEGYLSIHDSIAKLIPDFSGIKEGIQNTWQKIQGL